MVHKKEALRSLLPHSHTRSGRPCESTIGSDQQVDEYKRHAAKTTLNRMNDMQSLISKHHTFNTKELADIMIYRQCLFWPIKLFQD